MKRDDGIARTRPRGSAIVCVTLGVFFAFVPTAMRGDSIARAAPPAESARKLAIVRIPGTAKRAKTALPGLPPPPVMPMPSCLVERYAALDAARVGLIAKHGGVGTSFQSEYTEVKRSLVGPAALQAAGCKP